MDCPYISIGLIKDRCTGGCKPLETIFITSGLSQQDARYSSKNVLGAYAAITMSDLVRDGKLIVRTFASRLREKLGRLLPEELNQYIMSVDQKIAAAEKSNVSLEQYLYQAGKMGGQIFNLATPSGSKYDRTIVTEAGILSTQTMIMDDMQKDLSKDLKSGNYNPLKVPEVRNNFDNFYVKTKDELKSLMEKINFQNITQKFDYKGRNLCSDKRGICDTEDVIEDVMKGCFYGSIINCFASLIYLRAFDLKNLPVIACKYELVGKNWQWIFCESQQTTTDKCGCVYPEWYLWFLIGFLPAVTLVALSGLAEEVESLFRQ